MDFLEFYEYGGFFNNIVSLLALAGLAAVVVHVVRGRGAVGESRLLDLADRLGGLTVASGVLGVMFNAIEMGAALATVDQDAYLRAAAAGGSMVPIPLAWALMCTIPLWLASTCFRLRLPAAAR